MPLVRAKPSPNLRRALLSNKSHAYLWIVSLTTLVASVFYAWLALQTAGARATGPEIKDVLDRRGVWPDDVLEQQIVEDLRGDLIGNQANLETKSDQVQVALALLLLALGVELAGKLT
jgi:hypothetical protein